MAETTGIQWTNHTWNPWYGCHKVSSGCMYCYMMRDQETYGKNGNVVKRSKTKFNDPLKWKEPALCFTCSWSDWFIEEADPWRDEAWAIIKATPHITYQILTKRPERILEHLPADWGSGYENVWLGVSVENQKAAEVRIPLLMKVNAKIRFLSCEPLLSEINISNKGINNGYSVPTRYETVNGKQVGIEWTDPGNDFVGVDWVIVGGESGNDVGKWRYRPCEQFWIELIIGTCIVGNVPVFIKQLGTHLAKELRLKDRSGGHMAEWPVELMIRYFPKIVYGKV